MPTNSPEFKKLAAKWDKILAKTGLVNIEKDDKIIVWSSDFLKSSTLARRPAQEEYYRLASIFTHEHTFESIADKAIWEYYAEGKAVRDISVLLKQRRFKLHSKSHIDRRIQALAKIMLAKYKVGVTRE